MKFIPCINKKRKSQHRCEFLLFMGERMLNMPISQQDKLNLLKDILSNHQVDSCGSISECEQLKRLVKSLMVHPNLDQNSKKVLEEIYYYSQQGAYTPQLDQHIESHQQELSQWVNDINQFS